MPAYNPNLLCCGTSAVLVWHQRHARPVRPFLALRESLCIKPIFVSCILADVCSEVGASFSINLLAVASLVDIQA